MERKKKKRLWSLGAVAILGIATITVLSTNTSPILANPEKHSSKVNEDPTKKLPKLKESQNRSDKNNVSTRRLNPVENENGLKATAKVLTLDKDAVFPDLTTEDGQSQLFSEVILPDPESGASYEYVTAEGSSVTPESGNTGFQMIYVKITENSGSSSVIVPIPVTVTDSGTTLLVANGVALQVDDTNGKIVLYPKDTRDKTETELQQLIQTKGNVRAWDLETGTAIPVNVLSTTIDGTTVGEYTATFEVTVGTGADEQKETASQPVVVFGADLKAPYYATVVQNKVLDMGTDATNLFGKSQTLTAASDSATYEWVTDETGKVTVPDNRFNSSKLGFQMGYIKMTDKENNAISTIIPIPVTVTNTAERTVIVSTKAGLHFNAPFLSWSEFKGKTEAQLLSQLTEKLSLKAWSLTTGEPLEAEVTSTKMTETDQKGAVTVTIMSGKETLSYNLDVSVFPDGVFGDDTEGWRDIPLGSTQGRLINPSNGSRIGFVGRGIPPRLYGFQTGYRVIGGVNQEDYYREEGMADIPGSVTNGFYMPLYGTQWSEQYSLIGVSVRNLFKEQYFLRKGNTLRQILVEPTKEFMYVYNLTLQPDFSFKIRLDMYNLSDKPGQYTILQSMGTHYDGGRWGVPIYSRANNSGFYVDVNKDNVFYRLKDSEGNWLTDSRHYMTGPRKTTGYGGGYNYFNRNNPGLENKNYEEGRLIADLQFGDSSYQIGTDVKMINPGQALKSGFDLSYGSDLSPMKIQANPNVINSYPEHPEDFETDYTLSDIPAVTGGGTVYTTYPDGSEEKLPFTSNATKKIDSHLTIPRTSLPEKLNEEQGTIKSYDTNLNAIYETAGTMKGLASGDYKVKVNIYNLGGKPKAQIVSKDSVWDKTASSLITNPVILPGHTAAFEYENPEKQIDTSKLGLQYTDVRMTDTDDTAQTVIIRVPVMVVDGTVPTTGIMLGANNFNTRKGDVAGLSDKQLNDFILKKSEAVAWDVATGSQDGVELSVTAKTLTNDPDAAQTYTASIQAKKGTETQTTQIQIKISSTAKLTVNFLDVKGNSLHDPYTSMNEIGSTVDLTKLTEVTDILAELKEAQYDLVKKPDNEVIEISDGENSITYQFNGILTIISAPDVLDFETQKATINAVKFTDPKVTGKPLVVSDTRAEKEEWTLKAKVDQPLTSLANKEVIIPDAIKYNYQGEDWTLGEDTVVIVNHKNTGSGIYDVTKERWSKGEGFLLDLRPGAVKALGKYQAKITITLENTK